MTARAHLQRDEGLKLPSLLERKEGPPTPVIVDAQTGNLLTIAWPLRETARFLHHTASGARTVTFQMGALLAYRVVGRELVVVTEYNVFIGDPRAARPAKTLLIGPNWESTGERKQGMRWACVAPDASAVLAFDGAQLSSLDLRVGVQTVNVTLSSNDWAGECVFVGGKHALVTDPSGSHFLFDTERPSTVAVRGRSLEVVELVLECVDCFSARSGTCSNRSARGHPSVEPNLLTPETRWPGCASSWRRRFAAPHRSLHPHLELPDLRPYYCGSMVGPCREGIQP